MTACPTLQGEFQIRTAGTFPIAPHLRPKPSPLQHLDLCPKYRRLHLRSPFADHWVTQWIDLDEAASPS